MSVMIDDYGFGRVTVNGRTYHSDLIIYPDRVVDSWRRQEGHNLCLEDIRDLLLYKPEVLIIGQGRAGFMEVPDSVTAELRRQGIEVFAAPTEKAVQEYNRVCRSKKAVAALHLTC